jgi:hypothetical protein
MVSAGDIASFLKRTDIVNSNKIKEAMYRKNDDRIE